MILIETNTYNEAILLLHIDLHVEQRQMHCIIGDLLLSKLQ